ncbi:MAG: patatin-like phospholipase family protein [Myxococcota bacterium]|nr:patatin-like phospholipase family protein [Myxococcota bacterium]
MASSALILAGAVAKGAFEAGALSVLAERADLSIQRVVGASSGALNGALFAAGLRTGGPAEAAAQMVEIWRDEASWRDVFTVNLKDIFQLRGAGTHGHVLGLMESAREKLHGEGAHAVELRIVLTDLTGQVGSINGQPATTFGNVRCFRDADFDSKDSWNVICRTALGSAALPIVYAPVDVPHVGPCLDGGILNNTPVKQAISGGDVHRIIVVCAHPRLVRAPTDARGLTLASEFVDILINERLYRDLRDAYDVNRLVDQLEGLRSTGQLSDEAMSTISALKPWRKIEIVEIRPSEPLPGSAIAGFGDRTLRERYIEMGAEAAIAALSRIAGSSA